MCSESFSSRAVAHDPLIHSITFISYLFSFLLTRFCRYELKTIFKLTQTRHRRRQSLSSSLAVENFLRFSENEAENKISFNLEIFSASTTTTFVGIKRKKRREKSRIFLLVNCVKKKKTVRESQLISSEGFFFRVQTSLSVAFLYVLFTNETWQHRCRLATRTNERRN